jgi:hypothetical protein
MARISPPESRQHACPGAQICRNPIAIALWRRASLRSDRAKAWPRRVGSPPESDIGGYGTGRIAPHRPSRRLVSLAENDADDLRAFSAY